MKEAKLSWVILAALGLWACDDGGKVHGDLEHPVVRRAASQVDRARPAEMTALAVLPPQPTPTPLPDPSPKPAPPHPTPPKPTPPPDPTPPPKPAPPPEPIPPNPPPPTPMPLPPTHPGVQFRPPASALT